MRVRTALRPASAVLFVMAVAASSSGTATAAPQFVPAESATIHPGVATTTTGGGDCTSNFVFTNGTEVFLGQAAHCSGTGSSFAISGCDAGSLPLGTPVTVEGADHPGTLAYSSWLTMKARGETNSDVCAGNDFALVKLHPDDVAKTNPTVPGFGGPTEVDVDGAAVNEDVYTYGNSPLRPGPLSPQQGFVLGTTNGGWTYNIAVLTPSLPGDSGSGLLSSDGKALGVVVTLAIAPNTGSNGATDLSRALTYANQYGDLGDLSLVPGTEGFDAPPLPLLDIFDIFGILG